MERGECNVLSKEVVLSDPIKEISLRAVSFSVLKMHVAMWLVLYFHLGFQVLCVYTATDEIRQSTGGRWWQY